jgi:NADH-quinone oxidoreductase subunit L
MLYKLAIILPLINFILLGLCHLIKPYCVNLQKKLPIIATAVLGLSFALSCKIFLDIFIMGEPSITINLFTWLNVADLNVNIGFMLDKLSVLMLFVVSLISFMVHIYSTEYMKHDENKVRFFSYLGLFTFVMYMLVTAPNLLQLFLGWEGVGVASYLLIGFWYKKDSAAKASIKAFLVNRVADLALIAAMILIFMELKSLDITTILTNASSLENLNIIALLLFIGAMGKSAQFGFHTWLPDAMEGPTPVSALIHSATMVSAGVFLIVRMSGLFEFSDILPIIAIVGMVTAIFASLVGLAQKDIKRVIAYSTCAQLGYMVFACGVSAYSAAMFHLFTHAFFKALLFLAAGSVIHACRDEQNMFKMGGLRKAMPYTFVLMWIGSLALLGVPPLAGFFSKDFILESSFMAGTDIGYWVYAVGTFGAMLTAIYTSRVIFLVFNGQTRLNIEDAKHVHESNFVMLVPMIVLGFGSVVAGFLGTAMMKTDFWNGAITILHSHGVEHAHHIPTLFKYLPLFVVILGVIIAYRVILANKCKNLLFKTSSLHSLFENKFYIDELYAIIVVKPFEFIAKAARLFDTYGIDSVVNSVAATTIMTTKKLKGLQTGFVADYNKAFLLVVVVALAGIIIAMI